MPERVHDRRAGHEHEHETSVEMPAMGERSMAPPPLQLTAGPMQLTAKEKTVSGNAGARLAQAKDAIEHTKQVFVNGAANQIPELRASKLNSWHRKNVMRNSSYWNLTDKVKPIAKANPEAYAAAKADMAGGGNCGEHAKVAFDYLRVVAKGETIHRASVKGLDHAFVLLGQPATEKDNEIAVSDPWPTQAKACLWEDHFAKPMMKKASDLKLNSTMVADGKNVKDVIKAGLTLSDAGKKMLTKTSSDKETEDKITESRTKGWGWNHSDAHATGKDFDYVTEKDEE